MDLGNQLATLCSHEYPTDKRNPEIAAYSNDHRGCSILVLLCAMTDLSISDHSCRTVYGHCDGMLDFLHSALVTAEDMVNYNYK